MNPKQILSIGFIYIGISQSSLPAVPRDYPNEYNYNGQPINQTITFPESESDRAITQSVREALLRDFSLSDKVKDITINTYNGRVTLRGHVKNDAERSKVVSIVTLHINVKSVDNQLEVAEYE
jgi:osmotically-inducible protein OsmY